MKERLDSYYAESNSIATVVAKLVNTQNVSVFEKLCKKVNEFLAKIENENLKELLVTDEKETKLCFYSLQRSIKILEGYKKFLIDSLSKEKNKTLELVNTERAQ